MASVRRPDLKDETLRDQGALNPRPDKVADELFAESEFFDPRDLIQVKYEMLRRVGREGWSVTKAAKAFGFSRVAFYRALEAYRKAGLFGLLPRRRGPRGAHKLSEEVMGFARGVLEEDASLSTAELAERIKDRFGISVHPRSVERALARGKKKG